MKRFEAFTKKLFCLFLCFVFAFSGQSVLGFAHIVSAISESARAEEQTSDELASILRILERSGRLTEEEWKKVYEYLTSTDYSKGLKTTDSSIATVFSSEFAVIAEEDETGLRTSNDEIYQLCRAVTTWSEASDIVRDKIITYINPSEGSIDFVEKLLGTMEADGLSLYESVLRAKMLSYGILSIEEVEQVFALYPQRLLRESKFEEFYWFSLHFNIDKMISENAFAGNDMLYAMHSTYTEKQLALRDKYEHLLSEASFAYAKRLFLAGADVGDIETTLIALGASGITMQPIIQSYVTDVNKPTVYKTESGTNELVATVRGGNVSARMGNVELPADSIIEISVLGNTFSAKIELLEETAALFTSGNAVGRSAMADSDENIAPPVYIDIAGGDYISTQTFLPVHSFDILSLAGIGGDGIALNLFFDTSGNPSYWTYSDPYYVLAATRYTYSYDENGDYETGEEISAVYNSAAEAEAAYNMLLADNGDFGTDGNGYGYQVYVDAELTYYEGQNIEINTSNAVTIADGWLYQLPYIEFNSRTRRPMRVSMLPEGSFRVNGYSDFYPDSTLFGSSGIYYFGNCTTHTNLYGIISAYKCILTNGDELYFNSSGKLISKISPSGYTIAYNYASTSLVGIKDSLGRELVITDVSGNKQYVYKPDANSTGTTVAVIEFADWDLTVAMRKVVSAITDANGIRRAFSYSLEETLISDGYGGYTDGSCGFPAIRSIDYSTGASVDYDLFGYYIGYEYETEDGVGECGSIYTVTGGINYSYTENGATVSTLSLDTEYYEHDGWDQIGIESVKLINPDGSSTRINAGYTAHYTSDNKQWSSYSERKNDIGLPLIVYEREVGCGTKDTVVRYTYDRYYNVSAFTDERGLVTHFTYYTANDSSVLARRDIPKTESFSFSVDGTEHTVLAEYALAANGKNISAKTVKLDGTLLAKTEYYYDINENLIRKVEYITLGSDSKVRETHYGYEDSDTARGWDGLYLTSVTVTGLYDADGTALADAVTRYEYDDFGNLTAQYDANGSKTEFEYDASGNLTAEKRYTLQNSVYTLYSTESYSRNYTANDLTYTDVSGNSYLYNYDPAGRLQTVTRTVPNGTPAVIESYTYDNCSRVKTVATAAGSDASSVTVYYYDERGELYKTALFAYGADINTAAPLREEYTEFVTETVDGEQVCVGYRTAVSGINVTEAAYEEYRTDKYGQPTEKRVYYGNASAENAQITRYTYDVFGRTVTESYVADNGTELVTASYIYDVFGNVTAVTDVFGNTATAQYDALGRKISETDAKGISTEYTYDALDRVIEVRKPLDAAAGVYSIARTYYDAAGNVIKTKQSNNADNSAAVTYKETEYFYDSLNRVSDVNTGGGWVHYAYDTADRVTHIYSGMSARWTAAMSANAYSLVRYEYDSLGNAVKLTDELGNAETYTYDVLGMLTKTVQRNGNYITYSYDALGNVLSETAHSSAGAVLGTITNIPDALGRTLSRSMGANTDSYTYANGKLVTAVTNGTVEKTYGRNGNVLTYTLKDGANLLADSASYEYDNALRLAAVTNYDVTSGNALYTVSYTYDENGNRLNEKSTAGTDVYYLYNDANLVRSMINYARDAWNDPVITEAYTYGYYTDGNQRMKTDAVSGKKTVYVYDAAGRLISETESANGTVIQAYVYTYDASGNRLTLTATGEEAYSVAYTYDKANRLLTEARTENGATETKTYSYDPNGNLLAISSGGTVLESYTYDAFGKMVSYSKSGQTTSYTYRPDGLLYTKQTGTDAAKTFIFSDGQIVYEQTGTDNVGATVYTYGLTRISAKFRTSLTDEQSIRYYYLYNAHGDVVRIISGTNVTVKTYDYDAFGNDRNELEADNNPFRYCGEYYDTATETYFLRARWYDPSIGRFTQQDSWAYYKPDDPLSLNLYLYCYGNPVGYVDPSGHRQKIQLGQGIWSLKNDAQGRYMLYNWLFGRRDDIKVYSWGEYMMSNKGDPRFGIEPLGKQVADIVFPLASELDTGEKIDVNITTQIAIENGEDIIGYQYLHGTNKDAGGFNISGWIAKNNAGDTIYALTYTWNDRIDPNFEYASDSAKVELAKKIPGATLNDYDIHIIWKDFSIIRANPKWYLGHSGWLSEYVED